MQVKASIRVLSNEKELIGGEMQDRNMEIDVCKVQLVLEHSETRETRLGNS